MELLSKIASIFQIIQSERATPKIKTRINPPLSTPGYLNRHPGATFLVLGNGPSLGTYRREIYELIEKHHPVVMGANHITEFIYPHYHAFTNRKRFWEYAKTIDPTKSKVLLSPYFRDELIDSRYSGPFEYIMYIADNEAAFDIHDGIIQASCRTVSVLLIGVAIVMGAERILVAGLDGYIPTHSQRDSQLRRPDLYYTETTLLKGKYSELLKTQRICQRYLDQIQEYMERHGMEPFKIITPTVYANHYCDLEQFL